MRLAILSVATLGAALLGAAPTASAQNAYSHAWCSVNDIDGTKSCYFDSERECRTTLTGIGGVCIRNQEYRGDLVPRSRR
jgi:hypothetical protein